MQNLTTMNLVDVILHTRVPPGRLVDWTDQAFLLTHLEQARRRQLTRQRKSQGAAGKSATEGDAEPGVQARLNLRRVGIRTATDLLKAFSEPAPEPGAPWRRDFSLGGIEIAAAPGRSAQAPGQGPGRRARPQPGLELATERGPAVPGTVPARSPLAPRPRGVADGRPSPADGKSESMPLTRARQVSGPTIPSAPMPRARWKPVTAARILGPKIPSTARPRPGSSDRLRNLNSSWTPVMLAGWTEICVRENAWERVVARRGPGHLVGERVALQISVRSATVVAIQRVDALVMRTEDFAAFISTYPAVLKIVEDQIYHRLREGPVRRGRHHRAASKL